MGGVHWTSGDEGIAIIRSIRIGHDDELGADFGNGTPSQRDGENEGETGAAFAGLI